MEGILQPMIWRPGRFDEKELKEALEDASLDLDVYGMMCVIWKADGGFERVDPYDIAILEDCDED